MRLKKHKGAKGASDRIFSEIIRSTGYCENCFRTPPSVQLQCAHIISRRFSNTRVDIMNAFCLCAGCHRNYTDHPVEFSKFVQRSWARESYEAVLRKSQQMSKVDWDEEKQRLLQMKQRLQEGSTLQELRENV